MLRVFVVHDCMDLGIIISNIVFVPMGFPTDLHISFANNISTVTKSSTQVK